MAQLSIPEVLTLKAAIDSGSSSAATLRSCRDQALDAISRERGRQTSFINAFGTAIEHWTKEQKKCEIRIEEVRRQWQSIDRTSASQSVRDEIMRIENEQAHLRYVLEQIKKKRTEAEEEQQAHKEAADALDREKESVKTASEQAISEQEQANARKDAAMNAAYNTIINKPNTR